MAQEQLTLTLDGVTVQHAGELLFDTITIPDHRAYARDTYIRCLEDFAFALVYGDKFSVSGSTPALGQENPSSIIIQEYRAWFTDTDDQAHKTPEQLLSNDYFRELIKRTLSELPIAYEKGKDFWAHFIRREAKFYFQSTGDKDDDIHQRELLKVDLNDPSVYKYGKDPPYFIDGELQSQMPQFVVVELANNIAASDAAHGATRRAIEEFVSRALLAHAVIYWWYERAQSVKAPGFLVRMPHITRTLLTLAGYEKHEPMLEHVLETMVRHALAEALDISRHRTDLIKKLAVLSQTKKYEIIKSKIREIIEISQSEIDETKKIKECNKLIETMQNSPSMVEKFVDNVTLGLSYFGPSISVKGGAISGLFSRTNHVLRGIGRMPISEYDEKLNRVFPELAEIK